MLRLSILFTAVALINSQLHADLVINGSSTRPAVQATTTSTNYKPTNNFQSCLAGLRSQAVESL